ncbi:uncharacterized protein N7518_007317 [Penicillium psychrosexuale]|uniref:uncharacterized protein n=1 Tax=Penicillium psychrosexuale TaxID=1002107 RepID=UPI00254509FA|nr:uncharacterized protein N7518_007317 [Penicillium psychrosexuale]KAJ5790306.1 hypothetical protein N7518_007317 [Penicillium psychrosexuale]
MLNVCQRFAITRSISSAPRLRKPVVYSRQPASVYSCHHLSTSPPAFCEDFFRNISRRWIFNETDRLNERYVKFRPTEL